METGNILYFEKTGKQSNNNRGKSLNVSKPGFCRGKSMIKISYLALKNTKKFRFFCFG